MGKNHQLTTWEKVEPTIENRIAPNMAPLNLSRKTGVIVGDDVLALFNHAQANNYAIPAINVTSSSTVVAALEAARDAKAPIILQASQGGAAYFAGKGVDNKDQFASIQGAVAAAHYIRAVAPAYGVPVVLHTDHCAKKLLPWLDGMLDADEKYFKEHGEPLFSSHMIDLSEETVEFNIQTTAKYLQRAAPMKQFLEMEIGITGGEEDGVNNEDVDNNSLYTQPEDIYEIYKTLSPISPYFSIAAGFGNVHGVYKPGKPENKKDNLKRHHVNGQESMLTSKKPRSEITNTTDEDDVKKNANKNVTTSNNWEKFITEKADQCYYCGNMFKLTEIQAHMKSSHRIYSKTMHGPKK